ILIIVFLSLISFGFITLCANVYGDTFMTIIYLFGGIIALFLLIYLLVALLKPEIF
ncbi:MAG: hypothetical protein QG588_557, partial [Candidatus Poribacteria bacterium]|nr:hypothetical protein [Candidatus Poribacteria bacterium]